MNDLVDELYNYLVTNNQGVREGIKRKELAEKFGVTERAITDAKNKINTNAEYSKILSVSESNYSCQNKNEYDKAIMDTYKVIFTLVRKVRAMEKKAKETEKEARFGSFKRKLKVLKIALSGLKKNNELHK